MVRIARPTVEVVAPDGTKSFWVVALPHSEAVGAVRKVIPTDHKAELSIRRLQSSSKLVGLRPGEVRKIENMTNANGSVSSLNWLAMSIIDLVKGRHTDPRRVATDYQAYAVASDGQLTGFKEIICRDDGQAISKAKRMAKDYDIEVWNGSRFVIRLVRGPK